MQPATARDCPAVLFGNVTMDIPIFPLELVLVPSEPLPLHIFEQRYQEMVTRCVEHDEPFVIVFSDEDGIRDIGCTAQITEVLETFPDGRTNIATLGQQVVRISDIHDEHSYRSATAEVLVDEPAEAEPALQEAAIAAYHTLAAELPGAAPDTPDPGPGLSYSILARVDLSDDVKQSLLEDRDEQHRLETVLGLLNEIYRGLVLTRETQARARRNGRVRTPEELAKELGLDD